MATRQTARKPPLAPPDDRNYTGWETWTNHRWAWEFLSRNKEFVAACDSVADGKDNAKAVAARFHLRRFKRYDEQYETTGATNLKVKPAFISSSVLGIQVPVNESELNEARRRVRRLTVHIGQMVVRFDLSVATQHPKRLDGQITSVTNALKKELKRLQDATEVKGKASRNRLPASRLLYLLKVLDMQGIEGTDEQRNDALCRNAAGAPNTYPDDLQLARKLAEQDFLKLAAAATKCPPKKA